MGLGPWELLLALLIFGLPGALGQVITVVVADVANLWHLPVALLSGFLVSPLCRVGYRCRACGCRLLSGGIESSPAL